jgi:hypothetical protein
MADPPVATRAGYNGPMGGLEAEDHANQANFANSRDTPPHHARSAVPLRNAAYIRVQHRDHSHWK